MARSAGARRAGREGHAGGGWFYAYATQGDVAGKVQNIQVARSRDLVRWERSGDALPVKPAWASQTQLFWAPDVHRRGRTFYMDFSAGLDPDRAERFKKERGAADSKEGVFCLGVATSSRPEGPFRDSGRPLECGLSFVNPRTGRKYHHSGENCCHGSPQDIKYAAMVARSRSATGPFETLAQATGAADSAVLRRSEAWIGPGHNSVVTDRAGQDWIAYHAIDVRRPYVEAVISGDRAVRRPMLMDRLTWQDGWPRVEGRTSSAGPVSAPSVLRK